MKKKFLILILSVLVCGSSLLAQYPIPSFNVPVHFKADFQEQLQRSPDQVLEKRTVHIRVSCIGGSITNCSANVWVYSLDGHDILGPFTVNGGETLDVEIDEREWGAYVVSDDAITVDVWIDGGDFLIMQR